MPSQSVLCPPRQLCSMYVFFFNIFWLFLYCAYCVAIFNLVFIVFHCASFRFVLFIFFVFAVVVFDDTGRAEVTVAVEYN
jgi:hypothetical protein